MKTLTFHSVFCATMAIIFGIALTAMIANFNSVDMLGKIALSILSILCCVGIKAYYDLF